MWMVTPCFFHKSHHARAVYMAGLEQVKWLGDVQLVAFYKTWKVVAKSGAATESPVEEAGPGHV